ncbi:hypothetical protein L6R53_03975 [Myxococcota bacterium]|nr:hypothetical protein [Myxococcota bacterium]
MDLTAIAIVFILFGMPVTACLAALGLLLTWNLRRRELEVRRLEAQAALASADALPAWIDRRDPDALAELKLAQRELDRLSARAALSRA